MPPGWPPGLQPYGGGLHPAVGAHFADPLYRLGPGRGRGRPRHPLTDRRPERWPDLVPWQVTFAPVLGRSRGRPATTMRHRRGPDPRPLSLCRSVRREDATTGTGHPGTAPGQVIRRGCHIHVVRATWLGHPRRNSGRRVRITSHGSTAECSSTRRQGPGRDPPVRDQRKGPAAEAAAAPAGPAREA